MLAISSAVVGTSADAKVKNDEAEDKLAKFRETKFTEDANAKRFINWIWPDGLDGSVNTANVDRLKAWIDRDESLIKGLPIQKLLDSQELAVVREQAIKDLKIP